MMKCLETKNLVTPCLTKDELESSNSITNMYQTK